MEDLANIDLRLDDPRLLCAAPPEESETSKRGLTFPVFDPVTGRVVSHVCDDGAAGAGDAVEAAHRALSAWQAIGAVGRSALLRRWYELVRAAEADLARILNAEQGKPIAEAASEVGYAASFIEYYAEEAKRIGGQIVTTEREEVTTMVMGRPIGVAAVITPWNFPAAMVTRKVAPALAAGCTVVLKPAQETPLTALALTRLAYRAGIPIDALQIVNGDPEVIGDVLTSHPLVRALSFTGSTRVGRILSERCASTLKRVSLELGGNAPFIVFHDAEIDVAVEGAMFAKFRNAGQACVAANRFFVQAEIVDLFTQKLAQRVATLRTDALKEARIGPLISDAAADRCRRLVKRALEDGARMVAGDSSAVVDSSSRHINPVILADVTDEMEVVREEIFGPVIAVLTFADEADLIRRVNASAHGLAGYVYTSNIGRALRVTGAIEVGMVGVNTGTVSTAFAPFGGVNQAGTGREGGREGLEEFLVKKTIHLAAC